MTMAIRDVKIRQAFMDLYRETANAGSLPTHADLI